jgi:UDP-N-acetylglucosamine transferase subunit ALG13
VSRGFVLALVGTDHHPFDSMIEAMDAFAADHPQLRVFVQYGTSVAPVVAEGAALLDRADLDDLLEAADLVVSHGGPATITEIRSRGLLPIVMPRNPALGEHVDGHQQRFARLMAQSGFLRLATPADVGHILDEALADPGSFVVDAEADAARLATSIERAGVIFDELIARATVRRKRSERLNTTLNGAIGRVRRRRSGLTRH